MLGTPSLQYSRTRYAFALALYIVQLLGKALFFALTGGTPWSVMKYRYAATRQAYESMIRNAFNSFPTIKLPENQFTNVVKAGEYVSVAVAVIIAGILAMIATIIGANLIGPVATAVGGALNNKNLTGAANSVTAQLVLLFVVVIILIPIVFIAVFGKIVSEETA